MVHQKGCFSSSQPPKQRCLSDGDCWSIFNAPHFHIISGQHNPLLLPCCQNSSRTPWFSKLPSQRKTRARLASKTANAFGLHPILHKCPSHFTVCAENSSRDVSAAWSNFFAARPSKTGTLLEKMKSWSRITRPLFDAVDEPLDEATTTFLQSTSDGVKKQRSQREFFAISTCNAC